MGAFYNSLNFTLSLELNLPEGNAHTESECTKEGPCARSSLYAIDLSGVNNFWGFFLDYFLP